MPILSNSRNYIVLFTIPLLSLSLNCEMTTSELNGSIPKADAGPDQTSIVGSYAMLDGSKSTAGDADEIVWWGWEQDDSNPGKIRLLPGEDAYHAFQTIGFNKEGVYRITLTVDNGDSKSEPDEVYITVQPREQIICEDPDLEINLRYALQNRLDMIEESALASLDSIKHNYVAVNDITTLNGIEKCVNLNYLGMGLQKICDLTPLNNLTNLIFLNLTQSRCIADISPLSGLINLNWLNLAFNEIKDISALENLTNLTYLNLEFNEEISDISVVANMKDMRELRISNSPIGDISVVSNLNNLIKLWLSKCNISDLTPIANLTNLKLLFLKHNFIIDISAISGLHELERLYLADNQIVDISALENLTNLNILELYKNQITNIEPLVKNTGIDEGDVILLHTNPLSEESINTYIPILQERGVLVLW